MRRRATPQAPGRASRSVALRASGTTDEAPQRRPGAEGQPPAPPDRAPPARPSGLLAGAPPARRTARGAGRSVRPPDPHPEGARPPDPHPEGARPPDIPAELIPRHVALVMDGNGRWAKQRGLPRTEGHKRGESALFDVIMGAIELGIPYLSAYAFSTENWRRSPDEVRFLMGFNRDVIRRRRDQLHEMGVRVRWAGRRPRLWRSVISELEDAERMTAGNSVLTLQFCVN
jgi:hypothetical protein